MFRPMSPTVYPYPFDQPGDLQNRTLHMVLTLQGRVPAFSKFLERIHVAAHAEGDPAFKLTVVYFTEEAREEEAANDVETALAQSHDTYGLEYNLIKKQEAFARGKGLQYGVTETPETRVRLGTAEEVLSFMDVDMLFTREYLCGYPPPLGLLRDMHLTAAKHARRFRCRANAAPGQSAYFPIPFSLFKGRNATVNHDNGDWRKYGLGMVCISRSDFVASAGYNTKITGWGREDVEFYERMLKNASLQVCLVTQTLSFHDFSPAEDAARC